MTQLVSIIIPCYNSEDWIGEAIDSALAQTYSPIEVIVIDDGSTDESLEIIKSYGDRIQWETGENKGQSAARNRGFKLSSGQYIQWLDADDYLLPDKIKHQVSYLEETKVDIVYSDWRYQYHDKTGNIRLGNINVIGEQPEILEALLSGLALTIMNCLTKRETVEQLNGFDQSLRACEDIYFWINSAINGAKFGYQTGCYSIYRLSGQQTVSTHKYKEVESWGIVLNRVLKELEDKKMLEDKYKRALAQYYFHLSKCYLDFDRDLSWHYLRLVKQLDSNFQPNSSWRSIYETSYKIFGFRVTAYLYRLKQKLKQRS